MSLPQLLEHWKAAEGHSSDERAARPFDVTGATFTRWRNGKMNPSDDHVPKIAEVIGLTADEVRIARARTASLKDRAAAAEDQLAIALRRLAELEQAEKSERRDAPETGQASTRANRRRGGQRPA